MVFVLIVIWCYRFRFRIGFGFFVCVVVIVYGIFGGSYLVLERLNFVFLIVVFDF